MVTLVREAFTATSTASGEAGPTFFDGKNAWFSFIDGATSKVKVIEFWGPYVDLDNATNLRWQEPEVDMITLATLGPKCRVVKTLSFSFELSYFVDEVYRVAVVRASDGKVGAYVDKATYSVVTNTPPTDPIFPGTFIDENGKTYAPESNVLRTTHFWYAVGPAPLTMYGDDRQKLYRYNLDGTYDGFSIIPGRKQFNSRVLCEHRDYVWVTGFNTSGVHLFDELTGVFFTSVTVNRDVSDVFVRDGVLYTYSRGKLVSSISEALSVTHVGGEALYGRLKDPRTDKYRKYQDAGSYWWRTGILSDMTQDEDDEDVPTINKVRKSDLLTYTYKLPDPVDAVCGMPPITYQHWDGDEFVTVTVPEHVIVAQIAGGLCTFSAYRLPGLYRGEVSKEMSGYASVSLGPLSYKGDNC